MNIRKYRVARFSLILLAVLAAGILLKEAVAPGLVRRKLIAAVHDGCETCELSLGRVHISLLPLALNGSDVRFTGGEPDATVIAVAAERVYIPFSLFPLFKNRLRAGRIVIEQPAVTVTEGDLVSPASAKNRAAQGLDLEIEGIEVKNSSFTYVREHAGGKGVLRISRINAAVGPVGSSGRLRDADVEAKADGLLERSGQFHLEIRAKIFAKTPDADVKLQIAGQDLAALNPFFKPNDGVRLHGQLLEARSSAAVRGARLSASVYVRYSGLSVKIKKNEERGALSAFFQTFLASVIMRRQNADGGNYDRLGAADLERKPKETIISFVLRGMKEAAMKVATKPVDPPAARG